MIIAAAGIGLSVVALAAPPPPIPAPAPPPPPLPAPAPSPWALQWGSFTEANGIITVSPSGIASNPGQTFSGLVTSTASYGDGTVTAAVETLATTRTGSDPNDWEDAWLLWRYTDPANFYYVVLTPTGWELAKKQGGPADGTAPEIFLRTGSRWSFPRGQVYTIAVTQLGATITISVNGARLVSYTDLDPLTAPGSIGLYAEDALAQYSYAAWNAP